LKKGPVSDETNAEIKKLITKYKKILSRVAPVKYTAKNSLTNTLFVVPGEEIDLSVFPSVHKNPLDDDYLDMIIETTPPKAGPEVVVDPNPLDYFSGYDDYIADKNNRN